MSLLNKEQDSIDETFVQELNVHARKWFAFAIAGMVCADGVVDKEELEFLETAIRFMNDKDEVKKMMDMVKIRRLPKLEKLHNVPRVHCFKIIVNLARISMANYRQVKLNKNEISYLTYAAHCLGFDDFFCKHLLKWAQDTITLRMREEALKRLALTTEAV